MLRLQHRAARVAASVQHSKRWMCIAEAKTTAVRDNHAIDESKLTTYLKTTGAFSDCDWSSWSVKQFAHGQSNPTYVITDAAGKKFVVRKQPPGKLLKGAHAVDREFRAMKALYGIVPVPRTRHFCEDKEVLGTPFFVYDFASGRHFTDTRLSKHDVPVDARKPLYFGMADALARLHSVDYAACGLDDFGRPEGYIARQVKVWAAQYAASKAGDSPAMDKLLAWLPSHIPDDNDPAAVVHGDFRLDNLIFDPSKPKVRAVLDWELSTIGHPISDLAYNCMPYHMGNLPGSPVSGFAGEDLGALGLPTEEEYLTAYMTSLTGHVTGPHDRVVSTIGDDGYPANWKFFLSFAFFRVAAILQGVHKRALQGNASAANAEAVGTLAGEMANISWKYAQLHEEKKRMAVKGVLGGSTASAAATTPKTPSTSGTSGNAAGSANSSVSRSQWPATTFPPPSERAVDLLKDLREFMHEEIYPIEKSVLEFQRSDKNRWRFPAPELAGLTGKAKAAGLWNLFLPITADPEQRWGAGLTNLEYATLCEEMGRSLIGPEIFNCQAPDTGNMEVLAMYGSKDQQDKWLQPLLNGDIRSCFGMTEPAVASSDATNMEATVKDLADGTVLLNGVKWWTSGAMNPECKLMIFMGRAITKRGPSGSPHEQHSMVLVPMNAEGVTVKRALPVFGYEDAPHGHAEVEVDNVVVSEGNVILGHGRGFEIAQGRLGPGRVHHCMRLIGMAQRSLELMIDRAQSRTTFGKPLIARDTIQADIARSAMELEQARLLTLQCAAKMDSYGNKGARSDIAMIKVVVPNMAASVIDRAIQVHGGAGVSQDLPLAQFWAWARALRIADGPDEVHMRTVANLEIKARK